MKKWWIGGIFVLLLLLPFILWKLSYGETLQTLISDESVSDESTREHKGVMRNMDKESPARVADGEFEIYKDGE
ncbi:hypothetical protein [Salimicrobium flavidum]|uniref:Uncharacterized protein n=1 Tax=Salimicrobium flavidum TaxID=570947 RepID=A0A1N7J8R7_9BACI|nr:hypothetical protein [Salimicrobium flavidum]SIS45758.1 hypothetical protein SAMN05421687_104163 [Salimicrobium flavidum]